MGGDMVRRLLRSGHEWVVFENRVMEALEGEGTLGARSIEDFVAKLAKPRTVRLMVPAEHGDLHCGPSGAGHFVKMVHNVIEYGLMAAYAEGLNILRHANVGSQQQEVDAETTPLRHPEHYRYDFNLSDITEVWRRGSVISSWLLNFAAGDLQANPDLENFKGRVSDSGFIERPGALTLKFNNECCIIHSGPI